MSVSIKKKLRRPPIPHKPGDAARDSIRDLLACDDPKEFLDRIAPALAPSFLQGRSPPGGDRPYTALATRDLYADAASALELIVLPVCGWEKQERRLVAVLVEQGVQDSLRLFRIAVVTGVFKINLKYEKTPIPFTLEKLIAATLKRRTRRRAWIALAVLGYVRNTKILPDDPRERAALALGFLVRSFFFGKRPALKALP